MCVGGREEALWPMTEGNHVDPRPTDDNDNDNNRHSPRQCDGWFAVYVDHRRGRPPCSCGHPCGHRRLLGDIVIIFRRPPLWSTCTHTARVAVDARTARDARLAAPPRGLQAGAPTRRPLPHPVGRAGPYVGVAQKADGTTAATLVDAPAAITWTFTSTNASYVGGGQWTTPASVGLSTGGAWLLPTPILVQGGGVPLTALQAWAPMRGVALDGSIYGGALHNIAYTGCARPPGTGAVGDGLVLYGDCSVDALNWYYEPA